MNRFRHIGAFALLWLTFSAAAFGSSILNIQSRPFPVNDGGGFTATLNGGSPFEIFCVDFQNFIAGPPDSYSVNVSRSQSEILANSRFDSTAVAGFLDPTVNGVSLTAYDRYVLAGWLISQYNQPNGQDTNNLGIQSAIWTLLAQTGSAPPNLGNRDTWLNKAAAIKGTTTYNTIASDIVVLTDVSVAGAAIPGRYNTGKQEMMYLTPEPATFGLIGTSLILAALARRKRSV